MSEPTSREGVPGVEADQGAAPPRGRERRPPVDVGEALWRVAKIAAVVVRVIGYVLAAVLIAQVALTVLGVNPQNAIARAIGAVADVVVLAFRDLFLVRDPVLAVVVNAGLAALFWILVAEFGSRLVRYLGARLG